MLLHQIQIVYHCAVPIATTQCLYLCAVYIATDKICASMCHLFSLLKKLCITAPFVLHQIKRLYHRKLLNAPDKICHCIVTIPLGTMYHCTFIMHKIQSENNRNFPIAPDTMCVSLCRLYCRRYNMFITLSSLLHHTKYV